MTEDEALAIGRLRGLTGTEPDAATMIYFCSEGAPASKARARWSRKSHSMYTPRTTETAERTLSLRFQLAMKGKPVVGPVAIIAIFYRPNYQRIDVDNLMKLVMDAATKAGVWQDDCFVTAQASFIELDRANPRTLVAVCPTTSTLNRDARFTCELCGVLFHRPGAATVKTPPKTCSRACLTKLRASERAEVRCPCCNSTFDRRTAGQRYCSPECKARTIASPARREKRAVQRPWPKCQKCGGRVSRREYLQCANCSPKGRHIGSKNKVHKVYSDTPGVTVRITGGAC